MDKLNKEELLVLKWLLVDHICNFERKTRSYKESIKELESDIEKLNSPSDYDTNLLKISKENLKEWGEESIKHKDLHKKICSIIHKAKEE